jgi:hypothetical protein
MGLETAAIIGISTSLASAGASASQAVSAGQEARNASRRIGEAYDLAMKELSAISLLALGYQWR